jgi:hypothetical protein
VYQAALRSGSRTEKVTSSRPVMRATRAVSQPDSLDAGTRSADECKPSARPDDHRR